MAARTLSYTEISKAYSCSAQWDFAYGGRLAGDTLTRLILAPKLSDGRAWGAAVAAYHAHIDGLTPSFYAHAALDQALGTEVDDLREKGIAFDLKDKLAQRDRLGEILDHYMATCDPLGGRLTRLEGEINVPIRSRSSSRSSSRYRFHCFIDGYVVDENGHQWIVEFKFRDQLTPIEHLERDRQIRWYAWALRQSQSGNSPVGVLVDERVSYAPEEPKIVWAKNRKDRVPSSDVSQRTTPERYRAACEQYEVATNPDVLDALKRRQWQHRPSIIFRADELDAAGEDLIAAARRIHMLDSGLERPVRNARLPLCRSCTFAPICAEPGDRLYVETMFARGLPKRLRGVDTDLDVAQSVEEVAA